jgi:phosphoribosylanthranilate isomerase
MASADLIKLKVCGMRDPDNIRQVAALHPDYMGFIFYPDSKRVVSETFHIPDDFPSGIKKVGVFVNESNRIILGIAKKYSLDFIQLHGDESAEQCDQLRKTGIGVMKVFSVASDFDFRRTLPYKKMVDYFLFDTKGIGYGGTGATFDWSILERYDQEIPFFLSGGITTENIRDVRRLRSMNVHAVDVNSGVEVRPGIKDTKKVKKLKLEMNTY